MGFEEKVSGAGGLYTLMCEPSSPFLDHLSLLGFFSHLQSWYTFLGAIYFYLDLYRFNFGE